MRPPLPDPAAARRASLELRRRRAALKKCLANRDCTFADALHNQAARGMKVMSLLMALPGIRQARASQILQEVGIKPTNSVALCGPRQIAALLERVERYEKARPGEGQARRAP